MLLNVKFFITWASLYVHAVEALFKMKWLISFHVN